MTPVAALCTSAPQRPELGDFARDALRRDVAADEDRLGPLGAELLGGLLGRLVVPEVADADPRRALVREPMRDRLPDPARAARHEDGGALEMAYGFSGSSAGAVLGIVSQPGLVRGSRGPSSAFEDAYPSRSRSSAFSSAYRRTSGSGSVLNELDDRARS